MPRKVLGSNVTQVLIDDRAEPSVKAHISSTWDALNPCCARPGLARNLRKQRITANDLSTSDFSGVLRGLACSAKIAVADCELQHARNRTHTSSNGRSGYAAFCVSSILDEAKLFHKQSLKSSLLRDRMQKVSLNSTS